MAQAVFDEHPLEQYLREAGDAPELMPGSSTELLVDLTERDEAEDEYSPSHPIITYLFTAISFIIQTYSERHADSPFAERFKYDVISSSLLSTALPVPHSARSPRSRTFPGTISPGHSSRASSIDRIDIQHHSLPSRPTESHYWISSVAFALSMVLLRARYYFLSLIILSGPFFSVYILATETLSKHDMTPSLDTLKDLMAASDVWDSVVQEAMTVLEKDESKYGSLKSSSPASALRVALQSSLNSTQTQCDNVRQLFTALTAPSELSQLSEMYAPPSPTPTSHSLPISPELRPISLNFSASMRRKRTSSSPSATDSKRATWNGFYSELANAGTPSMQILGRREKRRSDLSALLGSSTSLSGSTSAPSTPQGNLSPKLDGLKEEEESEPFDPSSTYMPVSSNILTSSDPNYEQFGFAALDLHRKRRSGGLEAFGLRPRSPLRQSFGDEETNYTPFPSSTAPRTSLTPPRRLRSPPSTISSASRFTSLQLPRHPLSLSALNHSLNAALSARRYTCSHLLALRFEEETDDAYWENVRSVMSLLTTTLADASARLSEALDESEMQRLKDENPSPESLPSHSRSSSLEEPTAANTKKARSMREMMSFAPVPSHLSRFAAHVDAVSTALNDAREQLEQCVASLKEEREGSRSAHQHTRSPSEEVPPEQEEHPALQAYERLRRELGLALRECERGRERLLDITRPPSAHDSDPEDLPVLVADASDESDKQDSLSSPFDDDLANAQPNVVVVTGGGDGSLDDATTHLLQTTSSAHLPPPGIEQVFESDAGSVGVFTREKSKLTREERIQMVKKARESGKRGLSYSGPSIKEEDEKMDRRASLGNGGPSVEVVEELKDVIWKVSERRRKMADAG